MYYYTNKNSKESVIQSSERKPEKTFSKKSPWQCKIYNFRNFYRSSFTVHSWLKIREFSLIGNFCFHLQLFLIWIKFLKELKARNKLSNRETLNVSPTNPWVNLFCVIQGENNYEIQISRSYLLHQENSLTWLLSNQRRNFQIFVTKSSFSWYSTVEITCYLQSESNTVVTPDKGSFLSKTNWKHVVIENIL